MSLILSSFCPDSVLFCVDLCLICADFVPILCFLLGGVQNTSQRNREFSALDAIPANR